MKNITFTEKITDSKKSKILRSLFNESNIIYLILFMALILRIYHIDYPYLDHHSWRQTDTAAIARNLYESGFDILHPQVDWRGNGPGYVETEFQLLSFVTALLYIPFGVHEWIGRLIVIAFALASIYYLYKLVMLYYDRKTALFSAFLFAISPLFLFFSRAFMPETEMLFFSITSLYFFKLWTTGNRKKHMLLAILCTTLAFLVKIPTLYLSIPLLYIAYEKYGFRLFLQKSLYIFTIAVLITPALYYYHAYLLGKEYLSFGIWEFGKDKWGSAEILTNIEFYNVLYSRITTIILTGIGIILMLLGLFIKTRKKRVLMFHFWLLSIIVYFLGVARGNMVHDYYQIPLVPVAAVFAGLTLSRMTKFKKTNYLVIPAILLITYNSLAIVSPYYGVIDNTYEICNIYKNLNESDSLVIAVDSGNPEILYYCHAKGWHINTRSISNEIINDLKGKGAKYLITNNMREISSSNKTDTHNYKIVATTKDRSAYILDLWELSDNSDIYVMQNGNPDIKYKNQLTFDKKIEFLGYDSDYLKSDSTQLEGFFTYYPDSKNQIHISYYWKALSKIDRDYIVFVHFLNETGDIVFQNDHKPTTDIYPISKWKQSEIIKEEYWIDVPENIKQGRYYIKIGLYNESGRLPVTKQNYEFLNQTPQIQNPRSINYNNTFQFLGYDIDKTQIEQDGKFKITYYWKSLEKTEKDYTIFVHFLNETRQIGFQNDYKPPISTSDWAPGMIYKETQTVHVPENVKTGNYYLFTGLYFPDKEILPIVKEDKIPEIKEILSPPPQIKNSAFDIYANKIAFLGYNIDSENISKGSSFKMTYFWKSLDYVDINYTIFVHFIDDNKRIIFQQDHEAAYGIYPTGMWKPGDIVTEEYDIYVLDTIQEGNYMIRIGLYEKKDGTRLTLADKKDNQVIGSIKIIEKESILKIVPKSEEFKQKLSTDDSGIIGTVVIGD